MMTLMLAAAAAAAQPAPVPVQANPPHTMQMGQSGELKGTDCCKDCCKDMDAKHQSTKHDGHSAR